MSFARAGKSKPVDNHPAAMSAKVKIRRSVLEVIGAGAAHVFDGFAGSGKLHDAVWKEADSYVGCDLRWFPDQDRPAFVADNRRVLRAVDLARFTIFDLDAYGSPWECCVIIAARRRVSAGEKIGVIITDGLGIAYKANSMPNAIRVLTGLSPGIVGMGRKQDDIIDRCVAGLAKKMRCKIERRWQAHRDDGAAPRYVGLVLVGL